MQLAGSEQSSIGFQPILRAHYGVERWEDGRMERCLIDLGKRERDSM
jgi:hypothetical protein